MRTTCLYCASKHISQAIVLLLEGPQGYPLHRWLAVGHLAEAGDELVVKFPALAQKTRGIRLKIMGQSEGFDPLSLMDLLEDVRRVAEDEGQLSDKDFFAQIGK